MRYRGACGQNERSNWAHVLPSNMNSTPMCCNNWLIKTFPTKSNAHGENDSARTNHRACFYHTETHGLHHVDSIPADSGGQIVTGCARVVLASSSSSERIQICSWFSLPVSRFFEQHFEKGQQALVFDILSTISQPTKDGYLLWNWCGMSSVIFASTKHLRFVWHPECEAPFQDLVASFFSG